VIRFDAKSKCYRQVAGDKQGSLGFWDVNEIGVSGRDKQGSLSFWDVNEISVNEYENGVPL
jgi:hypothetical protein